MGSSRGSGPLRLVVRRRGVGALDGGPAGSQTGGASGDRRALLAIGAGRIIPCSAREASLRRRKWASRMPIWCHQGLSVLAVGGSGVAVLGLGILLLDALAARQPLPDPVLFLGTLLIFGLGIGGGKLAGRLADQIPVACGKCPGRAYREGHRPNRYRCRACGHDVVVASWSDWGRR